MKKVFSLLTIFSLLMGYLPSPVFAQTATTSAAELFVNPESSTSSADTTVSSTIQITNNQNDTNPFFEEQKTQIQVLSIPPSPSFEGNLQTQPLISSSVSSPKAIIGKLSKNTYKFNEKVDVTIMNSKPDQINVSLTDLKGNSVNSVDIQKTTNGITTDVILSSKLNLRPGKYILSVTDSSGNTTTQDFTWGVLAINPNKSIYLPNEKADISMAVLDETGGMVCDAQVVLSITDPSGKVTNLTTQDKNITVNPQCLSHDFSLSPDYGANYQVNGEGDYSINLTAKTKNGTYTIDDNFQVSASSPFDVERITATRIYPPYSYPVALKVTANQNFNGTVVEYVPSSFTISPYASGSGSTVLNYDSTASPNQYTNMQEAFGVASISLSLPFTNNYLETQGFSIRMTDPEEAPYYASFGLTGHDGLDFATPVGTPVLAADSGTVSLAGDGAYGTTLVIDHTWGKSYYGHLGKLEVSIGQTISKGQEVGLSGNSGYTTGPHLHFGIKPKNPTMDNGYYGKVDPSPFLGLIATGNQVLGASTIVSSADNKIIAWNINVKKGDEFTLGYNFQTPPQSPQLYTIGPLSYFDNSKTLVFKEARKWQLAIDADSTAGPNNCSITANDISTGAGTAAWGTVGTNVGACANAGTTATPASLTSSVSSQYLKTTGFGFSIPTNAVIHGIWVSITKKCANNKSGRCVDSLLHLVKAGAVQTSDTSQADTATTWGTANGTVTYGSTTSISWGGTWIYSDINNSGFGFAFSAKGSSTNTVTATLTGFITATITYNSPPNAPTNDTPTNGAIVPSISTLTMHATDPDSDSLQYDLLLYTPASDCTGSSTEYNQSNPAWDSSSYASGATATLVPTLSGGTTYSWKVRAVDPSGSNTFGSYSTCTNFTTSSGPTLEQLMRHGKWFDNGVRQPFTF